MNKNLLRFVAVTAAAAFFFVPCAMAAEFSAEPPGKINKKLVKKTPFALGKAFFSPILPPREELTDVSILGAAEATEEQMVSYINKRNENPKLNCSVADIVRYYYIEAGREGIRPDIALCQALKETGVFGYGGDVSPTQNNFCGLGATGNKEPGAKFPTPQLGVRAHVQHLLAYASVRRPTMPVIDPRYELIVKFHPEIHGKMTKWTDLNGVWAVPGTTYGEDILKIHRQAKAPDGSTASLAAAELAIEHAPDDADAHIYRAAVYIAQGRFYAAKADLDTAIELAPAAELYYDRALIADAKHQADALNDYTRATELHPGFTEAYYNRGLLYMAEKKYKEAAADFNKALELEPQLAAAKNNLAVIALTTKHYDEGWRLLYTAGEINSANEVVKENQENLAKCVKVSKKAAKKAAEKAAKEAAKKAAEQTVK